MRSTSLVLTLLLVAGACRGNDTSATTDEDITVVEVHATGFLFEPDQLDIGAETTVTWINDDKILHTVTSGTPESPNDMFDRDLDGRDTSTSIVFNEPGRYQYFCSRHPHMTGVITVDESSS